MCLAACAVTSTENFPRVQSCLLTFVSSWSAHFARWNEAPAFHSRLCESLLGSASVRQGEVSRSRCISRAALSQSATRSEFERCISVDRPTILALVDGGRSRMRSDRFQLELRGGRRTSALLRRPGGLCVADPMPVFSKTILDFRRVLKGVSR